MEKLSAFKQLAANLLKDGKKYSLLPEIEAVSSICIVL